MTETEDFMKEKRNLVSETRKSYDMSKRRVEVTGILPCLALCFTVMVCVCVMCVCVCVMKEWKR